MQIQDAFVLWKECHGPSRGKTSLATSQAVVPLTSRAVQQGAPTYTNMAFTPVRRTFFFANVQWLGQNGHVHIRHHPAHSPVHVRALVSVCHINLVFCQVLEIEIVFLSFKIVQKVLVSFRIALSVWVVAGLKSCIFLVNRRTFVPLTLAPELRGSNRAVSASRSAQLAHHALMWCWWLLCGKTSQNQQSNSDR